jgi:hypothetical protein
MPTLDQYAYNIRNIKFWINGYRASGMFQVSDYGKNIDPQLIQDLGVVPLQEVDKADSDCPKVEWGCTIKKVVIPKLVDFPEMRALSYVGKIDKQSPFIVNYPDVAQYKAATRFGKLSNRAFLIGQNLYLTLVGNDVNMEYINIRGVFEEPENIEAYPTEGCDAKCYDASVDSYPMPFRLYEYVLTSILRNELNWTTQAINDELNNGRLDNAKIG